MITNGITLPAKVVSIRDADTMTVGIGINIQIRSLDLWAPELNTVEGQNALTFIKTLLKPDDEIYINIPLINKKGTTIDIWRSLTLGRVLGYIYLKDGRSLSEIMVGAGHGKVVKGMFPDFEGEYTKEEYQDEKSLKTMGWVDQETFTAKYCGGNICCSG